MKNCLFLFIIVAFYGCEIYAQVAGVTRNMSLSLQRINAVKKRPYRFLN